MAKRPARATSGRYVSRLTSGTLAVIMAGGRGERLKGLTQNSAKPATPFGGKFRIIDFVLSNCVNSGIRQITVLTQYKAQSLIQHIHRGWGYMRGEDVVVKVQRPGVREQAERDIAIVRRVAAALEERADWARSLGVAELADGFAEALTEELDFTIEARNITAVAAASGPDVVLPAVHKALSTERVLVMSRLAGRPLETAPAPDRKRLARSLLRCLLDQVMIGGVFHADPHPGNLMVLEDGRLGLLDFGSVGRLDAG